MAIERAIKGTGILLVLEGTAPLVAMALIGRTSNTMAPAGYLMLGAGLAAISLLMLLERSRFDQSNLSKQESRRSLA